jgi:hypothetical protein
MRDFDILLSARKEAFDLVRENPTLEGPDCALLLNEINANWKERLAFVDVG